MEDFVEVNFTLEQGEIIVNSAHEEQVECKVLVFDLTSKYAEVLTIGCVNDYPTILLCANDGTLNLDRSKGSKPTEINLPDYVGWDVLSASVGRYTLTVVLERKADAKQN